MTKSEFVSRLAERQDSDVTTFQVQQIVDTLIENIGACIVKDQRIEIRGLGAFSLRQLNSKVGRNPRTGGEVMLAERKAVYFRPARRIREQIRDLRLEDCSD